VNEDIVAIIGIFMVIPLCVIGWPIARAYARRLEARPSASAVPTEVQARLERMEQAIDSIAIEVERISEGQRFTTKLLSERGSHAAIPQAEERHQ
jgi:hypothetical protein